MKENEIRNARKIWAKIFKMSIVIESTNNDLNSDEYCLIYSNINKYDYSQCTKNLGNMKFHNAPKYFANNFNYSVCILARKI